MTFDKLHFITSYPYYSGNGTVTEEGDHLFLTICGEEEAQLKAESKPETVYTCQKKYGREEYEKIRSDADSWWILYKHKEVWDPAFGYDKSQNTESVWHDDIKDSQIVVADGSFAGVIMMNRHLDYTFSYAFTGISGGDFPKVISENSSFGSSDEDMYEENFTFLDKRKSE